MSYYTLSPLDLASLPSIPARFPAPLSFALDGAWCFVADNSAGTFFIWNFPSQPKCAAGQIKVFDTENRSENQLPLLKEYELKSSRIFAFAVRFFPRVNATDSDTVKVHCLDKGSRAVRLAAATSLGGGFVVQVWADQSPGENDLGSTSLQSSKPGDTFEPSVDLCLGKPDEVGGMISTSPNPSASPGDALQSPAPRVPTLEDANPTSSAPIATSDTDMNPAFPDSSAPSRALPC